MSSHFGQGTLGLLNGSSSPAFSSSFQKHPHTVMKHCGEKVDIGNLYRTLRRMEQVGWVTSKWDSQENERDKRVYSITKTGRAFLKGAVASLQQTDELIHHLFRGYQKVYPEGSAT